MISYFIGLFRSPSATNMHGIDCFPHWDPYSPSARLTPRRVSEETLFSPLRNGAGWSSPGVLLFPRPWSCCFRGATPARAYAQQEPARIGRGSSEARRGIRDCLLLFAFAVVDLSQFGVMTLNASGAFTVTGLVPFNPQGRTSGSVLSSTRGGECPRECERAIVPRKAT